MPNTTRHKLCQACQGRAAEPLMGVAKASCRFHHWTTKQMVNCGVPED